MKKNDVSGLLMELGSLIAKIGFPVSLAEIILFMRIPFIGFGMIWSGFIIFIIGRRKIKRKKNNANPTQC
jgi:hypothetical protein